MSLAWFGHPKTRLKTFLAVVSVVVVLFLRRDEPELLLEQLRLPLMIGAFILGILLLLFLYEKVRSRFVSEKR